MLDGFQVFYLFTFEADEVRVVMVSSAVVAVGRAAELYLQQLARVLEQFDGVVDGGEAGAGMVALDLFVYLARAWVAFAGD